MKKKRANGSNGSTPTKIDLGCGKKVREGFTGVDIRDFGQDVVTDLTKRWPWPDNSVEEAHASHFVEHLVPKDRIHFVNELYRVLKPGSKCTVITPHWCSTRAYGDLTHVWPPVCEFWFYYLNKDWRKDNAPHNDFYACDFDTTWGYNIDAGVASRSQEYQAHAVAYFKEAAQDIVATMVSKKAVYGK